MKAPIFSHDKEKKISFLSFDLSSSAYRMNLQFMEELTFLLDDLATQKDLIGVVLSSANSNIFSNGFEFNELIHLSPKAIQQKLTFIHSLFQKIEQFKVPIICNIRGRCQGVGIELSLSCSYRIASENASTSFCFSEIHKALIPCFGGTQRLSRLIGIKNALNLILNGHSFGAKRSSELGMVDLLCPLGLVHKKAIEFLQNRSSEKKKIPLNQRKNQPSFIRLWLQKGFLKRKYRPFLEQSPYPLASKKALDIILKSDPAHLSQGLDREKQAFIELLEDPKSANLIDVNLSSDSLGNHITTLSPDFLYPKISIVGAGSTGREIANFLVLQDIPVRLKDINQRALGVALKSLTEKIEKKIPQSLEQRRKKALLSPTVLYKGMKHVDATVEAVIEDFEIKKRVLAELEEVTHKDTIIASTTSSFSISELAQSLHYPERIAGIHFFYPLDHTPVVEIIRGEKTSTKTIEKMVLFIKRLHKIPIVVKDSPGFLIGRVALPYLNEALFLLEEGLLVEEIDQVMENFGMKIGPLAFIDLLGLDTVYHLSHSLPKVSPYFISSPIIEKLYKNGRLGIKSGRGIYQYEKKGQKRGDTKIYDLLKDVRKERTKLGREFILDRLLLPMIREALACLQENITNSPHEMEIGLLLGLGFPPKYKGILHYAEQRGMENIFHSFQNLQKDFGNRFEAGKVLQSYFHNKKPLLKQTQKHFPKNSLKTT